jgi:hypothetical protein
MRGWPLIELLGLSGALALLTLPLHAFTLGRRPLPPSPAATTATAAPDHEERTPVRLSARFVHPPSRLRVCNGPEILWESAALSTTSASARCTLPLAIAAVDLRVEVEWPAGTPETVVELTLEPDGLDTLSRTAWGTGTVETILSYTWP